MEQLLISILRQSIDEFLFHRDHHVPAMTPVVFDATSGYVPLIEVLCLGKQHEEVFFVGFHNRFTVQRGFTLSILVVIWPILFLFL